MQSSSIHSIHHLDVRLYQYVYCGRFAHPSCIMEWRISIMVSRSLVRPVKQQCRNRFSIAPCRQVESGSTPSICHVDVRLYQYFYRSRFALPSRIMEWRLSILVSRSRVRPVRQQCPNRFLLRYCTFCRKARTMGFGFGSNLLLPVIKIIDPTYPVTRCLIKRLMGSDPEGPSLI
jgi:hypothetical protein